MLKELTDNFIDNKYCAKVENLTDELKIFLKKNEENDQYILNRLAKARLNEQNCGNFELLQNTFSKTGDVIQIVVQLILENYDHGNDDLLESFNLNEDQQYRVFVESLQLYNDQKFMRKIEVDEKTREQMGKSIKNSIKFYMENQN